MQPRASIAMVGMMFFNRILISVGILCSCCVEEALPGRVEPSIPENHELWKL